MAFPAPSPDASFEIDVRRAEGLLFDLAGELRRVPVAGALRIHLRALQLKREVVRWAHEGGSADEGTRRDVIDELLALEREVEGLRRGAIGARPSGRHSVAA